MDAIIAKGQGIEDEDAPGVLEETRYWVLASQSRHGAAQQHKIRLNDEILVDVDQDLADHAGQRPAHEGGHGNDPGSPQLGPVHAESWCPKAGCGWLVW